MSQHVRKQGKGAWLLLMSVCVTSAAAQDDEAIVQNPYALKKKKRPAVTVKADPALVRALNAKIGECYEREQDKPLSQEDKALLREYGSEVVSDLASALSSAGCSLEQRANATCLKMLDAMECSALAEPIVAEGWDRNLTPEARDHVTEYAGMLSRREARCQDRAEEEAAIVMGVRGDRLALLIEAQIVIGQCELTADKLPECETELQNVTCERIASLNEVGQLQQVCGTVFHCIEAPPPADEGPRKK
jgi:hypothetical protein